MKRPILIVIPTLGRGKSLCESIESLVFNGNARHDLMFLDGDRWFYDKANQIPMAVLEQYEIVGFMGNDCRMRTKNWDILLESKFSGRTGVICPWDGIQNGRVVTSPFLRTHFCLKMGFVYPSGFHHYRGDRALTAIARGAGCYYYEPELHLEHLHYTTHKSQMDSVYKKGQQSEGFDEQVWKKYIQTDLRRHIEKAKLAVLSWKQGCANSS